MTALRDFATPAIRGEAPAAGQPYRQIGVRLWGEGAYERETIDGSATKYAQLFRAEVGDIVVNKIWARNGSVAVVQPELAGTYGSGEFPMFELDRARVIPRWVHWITKRPSFWADCDEKSRGTSGQNRIKPEQFLDIRIPLPSVDEQRRIVERIEAIAGKIEEARRLRGEAEEEVQALLTQAFWRVARDAPRQEMSQVAPLVRRPVEVTADGSYPELGIRSFGKGTFHKPALSGLEVGTKRLFRIEPGDLLFSNVFAWEGAIAVARPEVHGRCGSHRFITCVCKPDAAIAEYLRFYFLTKEGLAAIGEASPGGAGRNRTLGIEALGKIPVPVPNIEQQRWFVELSTKTHEQTDVGSTSTVELNAIIPAVLDKVFRGEM